MAAISVRGLTKRFGAVTAVDDLSFDVQPGTITGFLGPNGAGKTTTLRMLLGLVRPTAGTALVDGTPVRPARPAGVHGRRRAGGHGLPPRTYRPQPPADPGPPQRHPDPPGRRGARRGRARRRRPPPGRRFLPRHAATAHACRRPARRSRHPGPRRAHQRARPGRRALAASVPARPGRPGRDGAGLQPPAGRAGDVRRLRW